MGALLVEALISIMIVSMAIGISLVSSYNLIRKAYENSMILTMSEILLNECEQLLSLKQSQIYDGTKIVSYSGKNYTVSVSKETRRISQNFKFYYYRNNSYLPVAKPGPIVINNIVVIRVRVTDQAGRYMETEIIPQQW